MSPRMRAWQTQSARFPGKAVPLRPHGLFIPGQRKAQQMLQLHGGASGGGVCITPTTVHKFSDYFFMGLGATVSVRMAKEEEGRGA